MIMTQERKARLVKPLPLDAIFSDYKSVLTKLGWLTKTRPDISYDIAVGTQVTQEQFEADTKGFAKKINKVVLKVLSAPKFELKNVPLDKVSLQLRVYTDGSFANNSDLSSQLGCLILLAAETGRCVILSFRSYKCTRVTRSVLAAEVVTFANGFDHGMLSQEQLSALYGFHMPLRILNDSKSLFDVVVKGTMTTERRLQIDLTSIKHAYRWQEIADIG